MSFVTHRFAGNETSYAYSCNQPAVLLTVEENDVPGLLIRGSRAVDEGQNVSIFISLRSQPTETVNLSVSARCIGQAPPAAGCSPYGLEGTMACGPDCDGPCAEEPAGMSCDVGVLSFSGDELSFSGSDWDIAQELVVYAARDDVDSVVDEMLLQLDIGAVSTDAMYDELATTVDVSVVDVDVAGAETNFTENVERFQGSFLVVPIFLRTMPTDSVFIVMSAPASFAVNTLFGNTTAAGIQQTGYCPEDREADFDEDSSSWSDPDSESESGSGSWVLVPTATVLTAIATPDEWELIRYVNVSLPAIEPLAGSIHQTLSFRTCSADPKYRIHLPPVRVTVLESARPPEWSTNVSDVVVAEGETFAFEFMLGSHPSGGLNITAVVVNASSADETLHPEGAGTVDLGGGCWHVPAGTQAPGPGTFTGLTWTSGMDIGGGENAPVDGTWCDVFAGWVEIFHHHVSAKYSVAFDAETWSLPKTLHFRVRDDFAVDEAPRSLRISLTVQTEDAVYSTTPLPDFVVTIIDNDFAGLAVDGDTVSVHEGAGGELCIDRTSDPTADVQLTAASIGVLIGCLDATATNFDVDAHVHAPEVCKYHHQLAGECGTAGVTTEWETVHMRNEYHSPVVFTGPSASAATIQTRRTRFAEGGCDGWCFEIRQSAECGSNTSSVSWLVVEEGSYASDDQSSLVEVRQVAVEYTARDIAESEVPESHVMTHTFNRSFVAAPLVLSALQTHFAGDANSIRSVRASVSAVTTAVSVDVAHRDVLEWLPGASDVECTAEGSGGSIGLHDCTHGSIRGNFTLAPGEYWITLASIPSSSEHRVLSDHVEIRLGGGSPVQFSNDVPDIAALNVTVGADGQLPYFVDLRSDNADSALHMSVGQAVSRVIPEALAAHELGWLALSPGSGSFNGLRYSAVSHVMANDLVSMRWPFLTQPVFFIGAHLNATATYNGSHVNPLCGCGSPSCFAASDSVHMLALLGTGDLRMAPNHAVDCAPGLALAQCFTAHHDPAGCRIDPMPDMPDMSYHDPTCCAAPAHQRCDTGYEISVESAESCGEVDGQAAYSFMCRRQLTKGKACMSWPAYSDHSTSGVPRADDAQALCGESDGTERADTTYTLRWSGIQAFEEGVVSFTTLSFGKTTLMLDGEQLSGWSQIKDEKHVRLDHASGSCFWTSSSGYGTGDPSPYMVQTLDDAKARCLSLEAGCAVVTCSGAACTVRESFDSDQIGHDPAAGQISYTPGIGCGADVASWRSAPRRIDAGEHRISLEAHFERNASCTDMQACIDRAANLGLLWDGTRSWADREYGCLRDGESAYWNTNEREVAHHEDQETLACSFRPSSDCFASLGMQQSRPDVSVRIRAGCARNGGNGLASIEVDGVEEAAQQNGHNIVVVSPFSGEVQAVAVFDTRESGGARSMAAFLHHVPVGSIIAVATQGSVDKSVHLAERELLRFMSSDTVYEGAGQPLAVLGCKLCQEHEWVQSGTAARSSALINLDQLPGVTVSAGPGIWEGESPATFIDMDATWLHHAWRTRSPYIVGLESCNQSAYLTVDLGAEYSISRTTTWAMERFAYCNVRTALSTSGKFSGEEVVVYDTGTAYAPTAFTGGNTVDFEPTRARFVRHWSGRNEESGRAHFLEIDIYGIEPGAYTWASRFFLTPPVSSRHSPPPFLLRFSSADYQVFDLTLPA